MSRDYSTFDPASVQGTDEPVGYRPGDPAATANKRWTWNAVLSWMQGLLDISLLNRNQTNHISATGNSAGNPVNILPVGADANINLNIGAKGTGELRALSDINTQGNDIDLDGGNLDTSGGQIDTSGGNVNTTNGAINSGSGAITTTGAVNAGTANVTGFTQVGSIFSSGQITGANGLNLAGGTITANGIPSTFGDVTGNDAVFDTLEATTISVQQILPISPSIGTPSLTFGIETFFNAKADFSRLQYSFATPSVGAAQDDIILSAILNIVNTVATAGHGVTLPTIPAAAPEDGIIVYVKNNGANVMSVWPMLGKQIDANGVNNPISVAPGESVFFISVGSAGGADYQSFRFGGETTRQVYAYRATAVATTVTDADGTINADGTFAVTLPTAVGRTGRVFTIKNSGAGTVTITPDGAELIDGGATLALAAGDSGTVQSTGTGWIAI